jgi:hypothetical protein
LAAGLLCCGVFAGTGLPDFAGTWKLDVGKSEPRGDQADRVYISVIEQKGPTFKITTKAEGVVNDIFDGTFQADGKLRIQHVASGLYRYTKVAWGSGTLVFEITDKDSKKDTAKTSLYVRESWSLSPDGKVLTKFRRTAAAPAAGQRAKIIDQKYVFARQ